jgi:hypothetical protein
MTHVIGGITSEPNKKLEGFQNKSRLIEYITDNYPGCPGLDERTLSEKLAQACKSLDQYLKERK